MNHPKAVMIEVGVDGGGRVLLSADAVVESKFKPLRHERTAVRFKEGDYTIVVGDPKAIFQMAKAALVKAGVE